MKKMASVLITATRNGSTDCLAVMYFISYIFNHINYRLKVPLK